MDFLLLEGANIWDIYNKFYSKKLSKETFDILAHTDPTCINDKKGKYLPWIISRYLVDNIDTNDGFSQPSQAWMRDLEILKDELAWYDRHKQLLDPQYADINVFKHIYEFADFYDENNEGVYTQREMRDQADIVFNNDKWEIVIPKTWEASKLYGSHTKWCTASNENDHFFKNYSSQGPLYINIDKINGKKWQFHPASNSYFDEEDNDLINDDTPIENSTIAEYANIPEDVLAWYEKNVPEIYDQITEEIDGSWYEYELLNDQEGTIGYFKDGTLYDRDKDELGEYYNVKVIGSTRLVMECHDACVDIFNINNGLDKCDRLYDYEIEDFYGEGEGHEIVIGIDRNNYFCVYPTDSDWDYNTSGISKIREKLDNETWILEWEGKPETCDIVSLHASDIMVTSGIYVDDEHEPYIDEDDYDTVYFWMMINGELKKYKNSLCEGEGNEEEVEDELDDEDYEEEMTMAESKKNFISSFKILTEKLNNIHKRNIPLILD